MPFSDYKSKKLRFIFIVYWIFLLYIIAALIFWFIELNSQNMEVTKYRIEQLSKDNPNYNSELKKLSEFQFRKITQFAGEGFTFFLLIIAGAVFIYRAVKRQLTSSQQQHNFMMALTHELKTPIAVAKLNLETLQKRKLDETQRNRLLQNTIQETNRLNALCNNMLLASQMEAGDYNVMKESINLSEIANECVDDFSIRFPARKINGQITEGISVIGDKLQLQMAMNNLIDNAIKYSPKDSLITIVLFTENETVLFSVKDEGKGVADDEKEKIFEKFYRTGNAATKMAKGTGLGLYLTKKIVLDHHASIDVKNNIPTGSIFTIVFKTANL